MNSAWAVGTVSSCSAATVRTSSTSSTITPARAPPVLAQAHAGRQVEDGNDPAAQADDAAHPRRVGRERAGLAEADDLVDRRNGQRVLLRPQGEDDELS